MTHVSSMEYLADADASIDDNAINRMYYELVDPT